MYEALIAAIVALVCAALGWFTTWLKTKTQNNIILSLVTAIERLDDKNVKALVEKLSDKAGVKAALDKILAKLFPILLVAALILAPGCGLLSSGTSGAGGELGAATATGNFYFFSLAGPAQIAVTDGEDGAPFVKVDAEGATEAKGGMLVFFGQRGVEATTSSGGENRGATQEGGSGDVSPTIPIPGVTQ